ncbi:inovirus Gp2 family protein [Vibrio porteresiae]|uniref:Inovirus Gp2 family protein n=1 Tax=Vibrio porteresiae DSM 19223 TaxID=1123496 RepID=A0ABZ0QDR8_9VIBR|nr:inovirus Gp2 family protein [Vibrio porteresiae]WPC74545.1 inovirus Gp2 family protein [Vibrio porteresiae DSM 19223]
MRVPGNSNLTVFEGKYFNGMKVYPAQLVKEYLECIEKFLDMSLNEHSRLYVFRFDLRYPNKYFCFSENSDISTFIARLNSRLVADLKRKGKDGKSNMRYVWVKEREDSDNDHYHVAISLNKDVYFTKGLFGGKDRNLSKMIQDAWESVIDNCIPGQAGLVHFCENGDYWLNVKDNKGDKYKKCFERLSYLAKTKTKHFGTGQKNIGSSRK